MNLLCIDCGLYLKYKTRSYCQSCCTLRALQHQRANIEKYRIYQAEYRARPEFKEQTAKYYQNKQAKKAKE